MLVSALPEFPSKKKFTTFIDCIVLQSYPIRLTLNTTFTCETDVFNTDRKSTLNIEEIEIVEDKIFNLYEEIMTAVKHSSPLQKTSIFSSYIDDLLQPIPQFRSTAPETQTLEILYRLEMIAILLFELNEYDCGHPNAQLLLLC